MAGRMPMTLVITLIIATRDIINEDSMSSSYLPLAQTFQYLSSPIAPGDKILQRL